MNISETGSFYQQMIRQTQFDLKNKHYVGWDV